MANYSVGNIEIGLVSSSKVVDDIGNLIKKLNQLESLNKNIKETFTSINKLSNGLVKMQKLDFQNINSQFAKVSESTRKLNEDLSNIKDPKYGEVATQLNRIANALRKFDDLQNVNFDKMGQSFEKINVAITPFLTNLKESESALKEMNSTLRAITPTKVNKAEKAMKELGNATEKTNTKASKTNKLLSNIFNLNKLYWLRNYTKNAVRSLANVVMASVNLEETLNKFQVSFGEFSDKATKFANKLTYAFNQSTESIMNYMSTFNSMLKGLGGIDNETAYNLSQTLTQLALDYSSLFNVSVDRAMNAFQSVLSGQIRTIRSTSGIDVSETAIYQMYRELGGTKSVRQLSQLEKRLLRIYAVEKQMVQLGAVGDLAKTVDSVSNNIKQIQETAKELYRWIGLIARTKLDGLIKNLLSAMLTLKEMAKAYAKTLGLSDKEYEQQSGKSAMESLVESTDEAIEKTKELQGLLSFDKFEVLNKSSSSEESSDALMIEKAMSKLSEDLSNVKSVARKTADEWLKWLGYVEVVDEATGETNWELQKGRTNLSDIIGKIKVVGKLLLGSAIFGALLKIGTKIAEIKKAFTALSGTKAIGALVGGGSSVLAPIAIIAGVITAMTLLYKSYEPFRQKVDKMFEQWKRLFKEVKAFFNNLGNLLRPIWVTIKPFVQFLLDKVFYYTIIQPLERTAKILADGFAEINKMFTDWNGFWNDIKQDILNFFIKLEKLKPSNWGQTLLEGTNNVIDWLKNLTKGIGIGGFATGGFPTKGQLFFANEAGPELVGNIGGNTAVANNDMIVTAIEEASYRGFMRAMSNSNGNMNVQLDFKNVNDSAIARGLLEPLMREARRNGYVVRKS